MPAPRTVYLLHGLLCDPRVWERQREALASAFDVRVPQLRGLDSLTAIAERILVEAPERFALAGHSMGGRVALEVVRMAPERVARLALLDSAVHPVQPGEPEKRQGLLEVAHREGMAAMAREWAPPMVHPERVQDRTLMDAIYAMVEGYSLDDYQKQITALLGRSDQTPVLDMVRGNTLVLCGREDGWSPPSQHEEIAARLPAANLVIVDRCGHMSTMERPDAVSRALCEWLGVVAP